MTDMHAWITTNMTCDKNVPTDVTQPRTTDTTIAGNTERPISIVYANIVPVHVVVYNIGARHILFRPCHTAKLQTFRLASLFAL